MYVEKLHLQNIKCFEDTEFSFLKEDVTHTKWITLLGENATGKTTILQNLGILLAGKSEVDGILLNPHFWLRKEIIPGRVSLVYMPGNNDFVVPSLVSEELSKKIQQLAIQAFKAIDGAGLARVDFFLRNDTGAVLVNEINTLPGLTNASGFPKMWTGSGLEFTQVIDSLVTLAMERHADISKNKTNF